MADVLVRIPPGRTEERKYVWQVLLGRALGLSLKFVVCEDTRTTLVVVQSGRSIRVADSFFRMPAQDWLSPQSLAWAQWLDLPLLRWCSPALFPQVVGIFGGDGASSAAEFDGHGDVDINFDMAGSAFFMLTRYEEEVITERDVHGRVPSDALLSVRNGSHARPIVNEYVHLLKHALTAIAPGIPLRKPQYRVLVSHDVDSALSSDGISPFSLLKALAGDVKRRRDPFLAARRGASYFVRGAAFDPNNTYDALMDISEAHGLRSAFYFICGGTNKRDAAYRIDSPWMRELFGRITGRGHEIGVHPSYEAMDRDGVVSWEFQKLKQVASEQAIHQSEWGGRQHYLRWQPATWLEWERAGLSYDSSVGFPDIAGFRAGFCGEYSCFDLRGGKQLSLLERPLVMMEKTLFPDQYDAAAYEQGLSEASGLASTCRFYGGDFTILWHNSKVGARAQMATYRNVLQMATGAA